MLPEEHSRVNLSVAMHMPCGFKMIPSKSLVSTNLPFDGSQAIETSCHCSREDRTQQAAHHGGSEILLLKELQGKFDQVSLNFPKDFFRMIF